VIWVKRTPEYFCEKGWTPSRRFARRNDQNRIQHGSSARFAWRSMRRPRRAGSLSNFSHVKSIGSFWTEITRKPWCRMCITPAATWTTQSKFLAGPMRSCRLIPGCITTKPPGTLGGFFYLRKRAPRFNARRPVSYATLIIGCLIQARIPMPPMRIFPETRNDDKQRNRSHDDEKSRPRRIDNDAGCDLRTCIRAGRRIAHPGLARSYRPLGPANATCLQCFLSGDGDADGR
jgi:hypothetical protein